MIWASDAKGAVTYIGPEWESFTGQPVAEGHGNGWEAMLHPDDVEATKRIFLAACAEAGVFSFRFRLHRASGGWAWVASGAAPSISPIDGRFLGFLGAIIEMPDIAVRLAKPDATASLDLPPPVGSTLPKTSIDQTIDYVLLARSRAQVTNETAVIAALDLTLNLLFVRLGAGSSTTH